MCSSPPRYMLHLLHEVVGVVPAAGREAGMAKTSTLRLAAVVAAAVLGTLLLLHIVDTKPAQAAFPGPNGSIAFDRTGNGSIWTMKPDGTGQTELVGNNDGNWELRPAVSPDGKKIAYEYGHDIWVMNSDGSNPRQLTDQSNTSSDDNLG